MLGLDQDIKKKLLNLLNSKQYTSLEFEIESRGNIDEQHPLLIMFYASSKTLNPMSKIDDLIEASRLYEKVYLMNKKKDKIPTPTTLEPLLNMIYLSFRTKIFRNVLPLALEAFKYNKLNEKLIEGIAIMNILLANNAESIKYYKLLFQVNERRLTGRAPLLCCLNYASGTSQEYYLEECLKYSKILERNLISGEEKQIPKKTRKIKIAFLSSDLRVHSVAFFLKDLFLKIDKKLFEIIALSNLDEVKEDSMSEALKNSIDQWHIISDKSDIEVVNLVKSLDVDILIDLNGLTKGNRVNVMANRCALIQICWLGYNNSTGLKNMDYLIADNNLIKKDEENLYSEKILYLPKIWNAFSRPTELPSINHSAKKDSLLFSYGSFNNFAKISDDTIEVWTRILNNSNSRIYLKNSQKDASLELTENLIKKFKDRGVQENKIIFLKTEKNITILKESGIEIQIDDKENIFTFTYNQTIKETITFNRFWFDEFSQVITAIKTMLIPATEWGGSYKKNKPKIEIVHLEEKNNKQDGGSNKKNEKYFIDNGSREHNHLLKTSYSDYNLGNKKTFHR